MRNYVRDARGRFATTGKKESDMTRESDRIDAWKRRKRDALFALLRQVGVTDKQFEEGDPDGNELWDMVFGEVEVWNAFGLIAQDYDASDEDVHARMTSRFVVDHTDEWEWTLTERGEFRPMLSGFKMTTALDVALSEFGNVFNDSMLAANVGETLTCTETDAVAGLLWAIGKADAAAMWIWAHQESDDEGDAHGEITSEEEAAKYVTENFGETSEAVPEAVDELDESAWGQEHYADQEDEPARELGMKSES